MNRDEAIRSLRSTLNWLEDEVTRVTASVREAATSPTGTSPLAIAAIAGTVMVKI